MAIKKIYDLSVDLKRTSVRVNVPVLVQGDSAEFRIRLLDNGAELSTAQLSGITAVKMQSGYDAQTVIQTVGTLQGSVAVFRLKKNELFRAGTVQAMVQLEDSVDRISTLRFQYQVIPDLSSNYIPGEQDLTIFQRYMTDAQAKIDEMAATDVAQLTAQLAEKVGGQVKLKPEEFSDEALALVTGNGTVNVLSIPQDESVTPEKTTFLVRSSNVFNPATATIDSNFDNSTGQPVTAANFSLSDYIDVSDTDTIALFDVLKIGKYDSNKNYLGNYSPQQTGDTYSVTGVGLIRVVVYTARYQTIQINKGGVLLPYEKWYTKLIDEIEVKTRLEADSIGTTELKDKAVAPQNTDFLVQSTNLLDTRTNTIGGVISADGTISARADYTYSAYIPVKSSTFYAFKDVSSVAYYDKDKNFISRKDISYASGTPSYATPANTAFIRANVLNFAPRLDGAQINEGKVLLDYEIGGYNFTDSVKLSKVKDITKLDRFVLTGKLDGIYSSSAIAGVPTIGDYKAADIFALFDALMTQYPQYVTKKTHIDPINGETNYEYDLTLKEVPTISEPTNVKIPKMLLFAGAHGEEKAGVYNLYQAMKKICEGWKTDEHLETLRWNTNFVVAPVVNLHGFDNNTRQNENNVDIERNFPTGWKLGTVGTQEYGGTEPLSEAGSRFVKKIIDSNKDAIYLCSYHTFFGNTSTPNFIWNASATKLQIHLGKQLVSMLSRKWRKEYAWIPQGDNDFIGYADNGAPDGSMAKYAASIGIQASTFETSPRMLYEPNYEAFNSTALTLGTEAFLNWLLLNLRENVAFYNKLNQ